MGWLRTIKETKNRQANELSQLKEELRRVSEKFESREIELVEALEQQAATSEILRVIASSPTDIQPVLDTVVESGVAWDQDMCGVQAGSASTFWFTLPVSGSQHLPSPLSLPERATLVKT